MFCLTISLMISLMFSLVTARPAYAYIDPNAGGFFLQVVIPIIFGTAATITVFWRRIMSRIKGFFNRNSGKKNSPDNE